MNARKGIKTQINLFDTHIQNNWSKSMNARKGIKTVVRLPMVNKGDTIWLSANARKANHPIQDGVLRLKGLEAAVTSMRLCVCPVSGNGGAQLSMLRHCPTLAKKSAKG